MTFLKKKIAKLKKSILEYEYCYHTLNQPIISDAEYDYLLEQLYSLELQNEELISSDSPTQKVGSRVLKKFKKIKHFSPMLSLENTFDINGYLNFEKRIKKAIGIDKNITFCCELKIDGIAVSIIYENGILIRAVTRGDGVKGENVTKNVKMITSIPLKLTGVDIPKRIEVRGEIFMLKSDFIDLNTKYKKNKNQYFSNPRNAAAGALRHLNPKITFKRKLMFSCYTCIFFSDMHQKITNHYQRLMKCSHWGLPVHKDIIICSNNQDILFFYKKFESNRHALDFDIDGIVIKVNSIRLQKKLGCSTKFPRWAIALKFVSAQKVTVLKDVKFQVGRTGVITPVAYFNAVSISGVIIKKASLHNKKEIQRLNLHIKDSIIVCRSGDVIPKILNVVEALRCDHRKKIIFPKYCPVCQTKLLENLEDTIIRCHAGWICSVQKEKALEHFFSQQALNAIGLGPKIINELIKKNYVTNPVDFFYLKEADLIQLDHIKHKKSLKILNAIENCKKTTLKCFIFALGIANVGEVVAEKIANHFIHLDTLMCANVEKLNAIPGIGKSIANNIYNYFSIKSNCEMIHQLINEVGICWDDQKNYRKIKNQFFYNKKIVLTGVLKNISRIALKKILIELGAKVVNSISKNVDCLICGKNFGSKFFQAKKFGILIINEDNLYKLINFRSRT